jgi:hypothetical protein
MNPILKIPIQNFQIQSNLAFQNRNTHPGPHRNPHEEEAQHLNSIFKTAGLHLEVDMDLDSVV